MVGVTKIQRGNAGYWLAAVAEGGDDYYTKPGEAPGEWVGELADELGLSGQVDPAGYSAILEGRSPQDGRRLLTRPDTRFRERPDGTQKRVEPVLGYDVRFSAPKSVSLLYAFGSESVRSRVVEVMNEAVRQGIAHLEHHACMVQRGKGGERLERGTGFAGMAFRHRMSRAGDIALHVHVVISNLTRAESDGKWMSLASPKGRAPLYPYAKSAGVVFQAALRAGILRKFGLEFEAVKNGYADIKGFSRDLIDAFSTRSREIADWMEKHGVFTVAAAQTAAYRTRQAKDHDVDVDKRLLEWEDRAAPFGFTRESVEEMVSEAEPASRVRSKRRTLLAPSPGLRATLRSSAPAMPFGSSATSSRRAPTGRAWKPPPPSCSEAMTSSACIREPARSTPASTRRRGSSPSRRSSSTGHCPRPMPGSASSTRRRSRRPSPATTTWAPTSARCSSA